VVPALDSLKKEGEQGRKVINQYTRYGTVILAALQSYGIGIGLEGANNIVVSPGPFFLITTMITLTGGTMFLMWLGEQITARGIGNGLSLIIFSGIVANLPHAITGTLELGREGALSPVIIVAVGIVAVLVVAFIVFVERAQRRLLIQYPKRQVGNRMFQGEASHLPLKLNTSGHPADLRLVAPVAAGHGRELHGRQWSGMAADGDRAARSRSAALPRPLRRTHHLLRVLLHRGRLQPCRHRR
jgi:preprotein translocase subunit SecY